MNIINNFVNKISNLYYNSPSFSRVFSGTIERIGSLSRSIFESFSYLISFKSSDKKLEFLPLNNQKRILQPTRSIRRILESQPQFRGNRETLLEAIQNGNFERIAELSNQFTHHDSRYFSHLLAGIELGTIDHKKALRILSIFDDRQMKADINTIQQAILIASPEVVEHLLKNFQPTSEDNKKIFEAVLLRNDKEIFELLFEPFLKNQQDLDGYTFLHFSVMDNRTEAVKWALEKGMSPDVKAGNLTPKKIALQRGNLDILEVFFDGNEKEIVEQFAKDLKTDEIDERLFSLFLFSPLEKTIKFFNQLESYLLTQTNPVKPILKSIQNMRTQILTEGALVARFQHMHQISQFAEAYLSSKDMTSFAKKQKEFAKPFADQISKELKMKKKRSLMQQIEDFKELRTIVAFQRKDLFSFQYNQWMLKEIGSKVMSTGIGNLRQPTRYHFVLNKIYEVIDEAKPGQIEFQKTGYILKFNYNGKEYPLTEVIQNEGKWVWNHTSRAIIKDLLPCLEQYHEELLSLKFDRTNPEEVREFVKKLATFYWLGANLVLTLRGNSHYFLMELSYILQHHGYFPLIPKRETPLVDCIAISEPLDQFVDNFLSYFEEIH